MAKEQQIIKKFKKTLISFLEELIHQMPSNKDLIVFRVFLIDQIEEEDLIKNFSLKVNKYNELIKSKDEKLFTHESLFSDERFTRSNDVLKKIWCKLNDDDKECMWAWIDTFVKLIKAYQNANKNKET